MTKQTTDTSNHLALYVWEERDVLRGSTSGMICVLAPSQEEAWDLLEAKDDIAFWSLHGEGGLPRIDPVRHTKPEAFVCWGGG